VWIEGEAGRVEIDEKNERVELRENAHVTRDKDEVRGSFILYDQRSEFFSVTSAKDMPGSRVRAVIQPKKPEPEAPAKKKPEAPK
jgi:lipopolysaccharide export system protein LptA